MRVLHVLDHSLPLHSGYAFRSINIIEEQRKLGWETTHLTSSKHYGSSELEETVDGYHFYRTLPEASILEKLPVLNQWHVIRLLEKRLTEVVLTVKPDILHVHSPCLNGVAALKVARKHDLPIVYEMRASWEDAAVSHGSTTEGSVRYKLSRALETYVLKRVDAITTICEGLKKDIVVRGVDPASITVIPNAVDTGQFTESSGIDTELQARLGLQENKVIGFIGSFYDYEGLDILLNAVPLMKNRFPELKVLLVGGGFQDKQLRDQAQSLKIEQDVVFTGRVPHSEVNSYYDLIDILVYPRKPIRLTEIVTPLKPLEAMAQKRMLVASDVGGHKELINDGVTGSLFKADDPADLAETIVNLYNNGSVWDDRLTSAKQFVEKERTWSVSVARYKPIFEDLVNKN